MKTVIKALVIAIMVYGAFLAGLYIGEERRKENGYWNHTGML